MLTYSIAIRTLGTSGEKFREELLSITRQTIQPEKVMVYIAEGYARPSFTIGQEEYVWVKKGMVAQRALPYDEITSDCILMLDDDVKLAPDSAERLLKTMEENNADCVGADTFKNQYMSLLAKIYAVVTNLVFPHWSGKWAFKIHRNGSFSYNNHPVKPFYWSQSCAGPVSMWKKEVFLALYLGDELWLDDLGFAYGEDVVEFYKLYKNGYHLGILYDSGIKNQDGKTSSGAFQKSPLRMYIRSKASFIIWWRTCYKPHGTASKGNVITTFCFLLKAIWLLLVNIGASILMRDLKYFSLYLKGIKDGWRYVHSPEYLSKRSYILQP